MKHIILGAGPAGVIAAETIRKHAPNDEILIVGDEPEAPYSRMAIPYLLLGKIDETGTHLRHDPDHFRKLRISVRHARCTSVNGPAKSLQLGDGSTLTFDTLLIATGSHAVRLPIPGIDSEGVFPCWTLADGRAIAARAHKGTRVLQMGAGFIGCIVMDPLASRGVKLSIVEMGDRMVPRMMGPTAGGMIKDWCEKKGVRVYTGARVDAIEPIRAVVAAPPSPVPAPAPVPAPHHEAGGFFAWLLRLLGFGRPVVAPPPPPPRRPPAPPMPVNAPAQAPAKGLRVKLSTGQTLEADLVISATGVKPNIAFLKDSGITCSVGVLADERMQTNCPGIYAAGDCAEALDKPSGKTIVSAIQPNAAEQAYIAAMNMIGRPAELQRVTQINVLDTLGLVSSSFGHWDGVPGGEHVELTDRAADGGKGRHLSLQFKDDVLVGCNSIGWTDHVGVMRGLVEGQVKLGEWKDALMRDPTQLMPAYLATAQAQDRRGHVG